MNIEEVAVWGRCLTEEEINNLYDKAEYYIEMQIQKSIMQMYDLMLLAAMEVIPNTVDSSKKLCQCETTMLMRQGCQCGGQ